MRRPVLLYPLVVFGAAVWLAVLAAGGVDVSLAWVRSVTFVVSAVGVLVLAFDRWLWKVVPLWVSRRPNLSGVWRARLNTKDGNVVMGYMVIRQTFQRLTLRLLTPESSSRTLAAALTRAEDGSYDVAGTYVNEPAALVRDRSAIHFGGLLLHIGFDTGATIEGEYWTSRESQGEIGLTDHRSETPGSHDEAATVYAGPSRA